MKNRSPASVYPVYLTNLANLYSVVVGGGAVATRKVRGLLAADAQVYVISPELCPELDRLRAQGQIVWIARPFAPGDLAQAGLVIAATNARAVNRAVAAEARQRGILCNVVDKPEEGSFHVPAVYRHMETPYRAIDKEASHKVGQEREHPAADKPPRAEVVIAVGTNGTEPRRAVQLRDWIAGLLKARDE